MVFGQNLKILTLAKKRIPSQRASQEEQNGANFSSVAPSGQELRVLKCTCVVKVVTHTHTIMYNHVLLCVQTFRLCFSMTVKHNHVIFGVLTAPDSDNISLSLQHCSSFSFAVENVSSPDY